MHGGVKGPEKTQVILLFALPLSSFFFSLPWTHRIGTYLSGIVSCDSCPDCPLLDIATCFRASVRHQAGWATYIIRRTAASHLIEIEDPPRHLLR
ncbi:hypothetical protein DFP73DRAFT_29614 [Morchella snyderi]|nr:hypothetical protein DFP73DRAFT_29614 [Morchella snyderi]